MKFVITPPQHLSSPSGIKFDTYRFYFECICDYLVTNYTDLSGFVSRAITATSPIQANTTLNPSEVEANLKIAWNTEYLLSINHGDSELVRINNQWSPIQAYYAVYSGMEALSYGIDGNHAGSHVKAMRKCSDFLVKLGFTPWDKAYTGPRGKSKTKHNPLNFPSSLFLPHNLQRAGVDPLAMFAKCLKAEHSHRIDDKWKGKKKSGCYKYDYDPGYTTLLHFLYRLRIKSNYQEIDTFVTDAPDHHILQFSHSLQLVTSWTLTLFELILIARLGAQSVIDQGKNYLGLNSSATNLAVRVTEYESIFGI